MQRSAIGRNVLSDNVRVIISVGSTFEEARVVSAIANRCGEGLEGVSGLNVALFLSSIVRAAE
jgi:hypothetical protein